MLVGVLFAALLVSAVVGLASTGVRVYHWYDARANWRQHEYGRLDQLAGGVSRTKFEEVLGSPLFSRESRGGGLVEETFRRRGYWVQAISDRSGTVRFFSVTACDKSFTPRFARQGAPVVTLNRSTLASAGVIGEPMYRPWVATGNSFFYETIYGGLGSYYKTFAWGLDDVCPGWAKDYDAMQKRAGVDFLKIVPSLGVRSPVIKAMRRGVIVNTYGETDPFTDIKLVIKPFQIGTDRLLVRTVSTEEIP